MRIIVLFGLACEISRSPETPAAAISKRPFVRTDWYFAMTGPAFVAATNFAMRSFAGGNGVACAGAILGAMSAVSRTAAVSRMGFPTVKASMIAPRSGVNG
jgi:hypothetical protein